jgi:hypothetical protein
MKKSKFVKSVWNLLGDIVIEHHEYEPDTLTILVKNVNAEIEGGELMKYIKEKLGVEGVKDISFSFGDGYSRYSEGYNGRGLLL